MVRTFLIIGCVLGISGCTATIDDQPDNELLEVTETAATGSAVARAALDLLGTPYLYGGNDRNGFDCSGLVQFAHAEVGLHIPRTTTTQYAAAQKISSPRVGDVLFFRIGGRVSHNGIYLGDKRFIHAPSTGKNVSISRTDNPYFRNRLAGIRRFR